MSLSPELFFRIDGKTITTRPMKGTVQRGRWLEEDQELISWLSTSSKNQAENVMIVDLLRNDLSKIPGVISVQVPRLFDIESYPTVHQMTSTVTATVQENTTFVDVLRALFPSGSITGAPKISTMSLISELEQTPREIYCGTVGFIEPNGDAVFNVAIRSILIDDETGVAEYGVGGGITWDSTTDGEYAEAFAKAAFLKESSVPFELLETLKLENGEYVLLHRHLNRLVSSARFFDIPIDLDMIERFAELTFTTHLTLYIVFH
ncbi:chorismate-binding protein [Alicyclobacillus acidoterrestris]|uniref:chorismate-binding protein n=1 Tax=Alicyclobacillus acidoterrestris TaxID=1450 RepID=UPI003F5310A7